MIETIIFVNRQGEKLVIESSDNNYYDFEEFDFCIDEDCKLNKSFLKFDIYGLPYDVDIDKILKPLKFYKITWWDCEESTPEGHSYTTLLENIEEINYLNQ